MVPEAVHLGEVAATTEPTAAAPCGCAPPTCPNLVPPGWEGGYCVARPDAITKSEDERRAAWEAEEWARLGPLPPADPFDPHAEYGFEHPWEFARP